MISTIKILLLIMVASFSTACSKSLSNEVDEKVTNKVNIEKIHIIGSDNKITANGYKVVDEEDLSSIENDELFTSIKNNKAFVKDYDAKLDKYKVTLTYEAPEDGLLISGNKIFYKKEHLNNFIETTIKEKSTVKKCKYSKRNFLGQVKCQHYEREPVANVEEVEAEIKKLYSKINTVKKGEFVDINYSLVVFTESTSGKSQVKVNLVRL
jgi:hypothetical protein